MSGPFKRARHDIIYGLRNLSPDHLVVGVRDYAHAIGREFNSHNLAIVPLKWSQRRPCRETMCLLLGENSVSGIRRRARSSPGRLKGTMAMSCPSPVFSSRCCYCQIFTCVYISDTSRHDASRDAMMQTHGFNFQRHAGHGLSCNS